MPQGLRETYRGAVLKRSASLRSAVDVRAELASYQSAPKLEAQRATHAALIQKYEQQIEALESELVAIKGRITRKEGDIQNLLNRKLKLASDIDEKKRLALAATIYGGALAIATLGVGAVFGGGVVATAGVAIVALQGDLKKLNREIEATRRDRSALRTASERFAQQARLLSVRLGELREREKELRSSFDKEPAGRVLSLGEEVEFGGRLLDNLKAQLTMLKAMKAQASAYEEGLDTIIRRLEKDVSRLEKENEAALNELILALVSVALLSTGGAKSKALSRLRRSRKKLLLVGSKVLNGKIQELVPWVIKRMISEGLLQAGSGRAVAQTLGRLLGGAFSMQPNQDKLQLLISAAKGALTGPQRFVLELLLEVTDFDPEPLAIAVIDNKALTDAQARAIAALLDQQGADGVSTASLIAKNKRRTRLQNPAQSKVLASRSTAK